MRLDPLPESEYALRVRKLQEELQKEGIDLFVGYSSETESATSRYLTAFWPFFDFAAVVVPAEGEAVLLTGGPESSEFAKAFSRVSDIRINPLLVETAAPDWVPDVKGESFTETIRDVLKKEPRTIGVGNWNIIPHGIVEDMKKAAPSAQMRPADDLLLRVKRVKTDREIPYIVEAYRITEEAMKLTLDAARPGMREWELEAMARSTMLKLGAEGTPYPVWVCSGPNTPLSLCRSTDRAVQPGELIQFTFGALFMGYCGNMCRPFAIGEVPAPAAKLMKVALEAVTYTLNTVRPGIRASSVFDGYHDILAGYGYENYTLYGPAHGTGHSEVEGLWLAADADFTIEKNMLFNCDIWLSDGEYGLRFEDGFLVTDSGIHELTSYRREVIVL